MIPLALVTGFLGSGKTSFLRHLAGVEYVRGRSGPHRRLAFVVNDFSAAEVDADALAVEAARLLEKHHINGLIVVDGDNRPVGALNIHDLLRAKVV